jgi:DNA-directed RNA polymerase specialized sigma24 family protein
MQAGEVDEAAFADHDPTPSVMVANRELLDEARNRLTEEERRIADQRALGRGWAEIAAETGEKPDAVRIRFTRAMDRIAEQLGLEQ